MSWSGLRSFRFLRFANWDTSVATRTGPRIWGTQPLRSSPQRLMSSSTRSWTNPGPRAPKSRAGRPVLPSRSQSIFQLLRSFRFSARQTNKSLPNATQESLSLSARFRKLSREYGWSAVGVYLGLTVLDFPFCFLLVRWVGPDRVGEWEHYLVSNVSRFIPESVKQFWREYKLALQKARATELGNDKIAETVEMAGWGVEEAEARNRTEASLGTQLALAYAIHKSFIFVRVPLTAAITPKVVRVLRSWGWQIGKRKGKQSKR